MEPIVPPISMSVAGPLGIAHLPRLWAKVLLHACGRLPEGYRHGAGGADEFVLTRLGIEPAEFVAFIEKDRPDYLALEAWVCEHAKDLSPRTIANVNHRVLTMNAPGELAAERRERFGIADPNFANAAALNNLDDWASFHAALTRQGEATTARTEMRTGA